MRKALNWTTAAGLCLAAMGATAVNAAPVAQPAGLVPPPISVRKAAFLHAHPAAQALFRAGLARQDAASAGLPRVTVATGGSWANVAAAPVGGLTSPLLLTDGTVIVADGNTPNWYKLTPDKKGNYATGTWSKIASLPIIGGVQYAPLYHATALLPDGRVIVMGGEYNGSNTEVWTSLGAIYDPVVNAWTAVTAPSFFTHVGDAQGIVLANGTFMLGSCCDNPAKNALLTASSLTWTQTAGPTGNDGVHAPTPYQDEQGYELLPNNNVLTIDVWSSYAAGVDPTNAEQYSAATGLWTAAGNTPKSLVDPRACGNFEIGPAALRGDGKLVAFGGNSGCVTGAKADPVALYNTATGAWTAGPNMPAKCGAAGNLSCTLADAPAAVLPNGNILVASSAGYGNSPTHFFEFTTKNKINQVSDTVQFAGGNSSFYYNFLVLPNGQILATDFSNVPELYTPAAGVAAGVAPIISAVPAIVTHGGSFTVSGKQLGGRTQGAYYGDDAQMASNYPLVRITNNATGDVAYARTSAITSFSVHKGAAGSAQFTVPAGIETGASTLVVVANGVASAPKAITVN